MANKVRISPEVQWPRFVCRLLKRQDLISDLLLAESYHVVRPVETFEPRVGLDSAALPSASARQTASSPGLDIAEAVLSSVRAAGRPLSRAEILVSTGMSEAHWIAVIQELRNRGLVLSHGRKRGTTWGLAGSPSPTPDED